MNVFALTIAGLMWAFFVRHNPRMVAGWLSVGQLVLLISRTIGCSLFHRLVRGDGSTVVSMAVIAICAWVWLLLFVASSIFGRLTSLVLVYGSMVSVRH